MDDGDDDDNDDGDDDDNDDGDDVGRAIIKQIRSKILSPDFFSCSAANDSRISIKRFNFFFNDDI